ncbi:Ppx/GppA phosphatase family protein [Fodinibius halophilus]|nr:Ppx/GppA phosphatase family protein [Fodinibius halophilus]
MASQNNIAKKRIAALDLGTNSFHAVIVDVYSDGRFRTVDKLKEMVRLGEGVVDNRLTDDVMDRAISSLHKIKILCDSKGVEKMLSCATSAIREAENGGVFIQRMIDEVGIKALAISGGKEAELIGRAIQHAVSFEDETVLMVDIGGGSVELIIGDNETITFSTSKKLGVARMAGLFVDNDPITETEIDQLCDHFKKELSDVFEAVDAYDIKTIIGSSGTMENIADMIANEESITASVTLNGLEYPTSCFQEFYDYFIKLDRDSRLDQKGLDEKRVDIITPGLVLLKLLIEQCGIRQVRISESALREGMVLDYINDKQDELELDLLEQYPNPRRRSVFELLRKCNWHEAHSRHVTEMALQLFDEFREELNLPDEDRELLEYAGYLHDIGYYISHRKHHKHALYIIRHADLKGFTENEINIIANVARYHRRSTPKKRHKRYRKLDKPLRKRVKKLSALLRVADGLDRSHYQNVQELEIKKGNNKIQLIITTESDPQLEIWGAMRKSHLFEKVTDKELQIFPKEDGKVIAVEQPTPYPEHKS